MYTYMYICGEVVILIKVSRGHSSVEGHLEQRSDQSRCLSEANI